MYYSMQAEVQPSRHIETLLAISGQLMQHKGMDDTAIPTTNTLLIMVCCHIPRQTHIPTTTTVSL